MHNGTQTINECYRIWKLHQTLEEVAAELCDVRLDPQTTVPVIDNVQQPDAGITQAPSVWRMLEETTDVRVVEWLLEACLFGELGRLKLLQTGVVVPLQQEENYSASIRLEMLIKITKQRRSRYVDHPHHILPADTVSAIINDWKNDYTTWMSEESQLDYYECPRWQRHVYVRTRHRTFLWKMCGNYHLVIFWLYVPASWMTLRIFKQTVVDDTQERSNDTKVKNAVEAVRSALRNADR